MMAQRSDFGTKPQWVLALRSGRGDGSRKVGGLALTLRLALDAQAAGAHAVVVETAEQRQRLADPRLRIAVLDTVPEEAARLSIADDYVMPRQWFKLAADAGLPAAGQTRDLEQDPPTDPVPYGFEPLHVTDGESARRAERSLFRALRKPQDGWTSRYLNRYISLAISRVLVRTPLRPNQVSVGILAVGILGAVCASRGDYLSLLVGASLFQAQSVLDGCDGEMSRMTHRGSLLGQWLDTVGDDLTNYGFFGGAAWGLYHSTGHFAYLLAGAVTISCGVLASGIEYRYLIRIGSGDLLQYPLSAQSSAADAGLYGKIAPLFKRDTFVFLTWVAALLSWVGPMLFVFAAGAVGVLIGVLKTEAMMARERRGSAS